MAGAKTVRLRSAAGVVVETSEENAAHLPTGVFKPVEQEKPTRKRAAQADDDD